MYVAMEFCVSSNSFVLSNSLCPLYKVSLTNKHLPVQSSGGGCDSIQLKPSNSKQTTTDSLSTDDTAAATVRPKPQGVLGATGQFKIGRGRGILMYSDDIRKPQTRS